MKSSFNKALTSVAGARSLGFFVVYFRLVVRSATCYLVESLEWIDFVLSPGVTCTVFRLLEIGDSSQHFRVRTATLGGGDLYRKQRSSKRTA